MSLGHNKPIRLHMQIVKSDHIKDQNWLVSWNESFFLNFWDHSLVWYCMNTLEKNVFQLTMQQSYQFLPQGIEKGHLSFDTAASCLQS